MSLISAAGLQEVEEEEGVEKGKGGKKRKYDAITSDTPLLHPTKMPPMGLMVGDLLNE